MKNKEVHLANIKKHREKIETILNTYKDMEERAKKSDTDLPKLVDLTGQFICVNISNCGQVLQELFFPEDDIS